MTTIFDRHVDYSKTYLPCDIPTKIEGKPSYSILTNLKKELQANASSMDSELGGGNHGYLGLVLNDVEYTAITGTTPFIAPAYPLALTIPDTATQIEAISRRTIKNSIKHLINENFISLQDPHMRINNRLNNILNADLPSILHETANKNSIVIAKGDSATSDIYWRSEDKHCLMNIHQAPSCPIQLPNQIIVQGTHTGQLPLHPMLSQVASKAKILPDLKSVSLISIGKLCDDDCNVIFEQHKMEAIKNDKVILKGYRNFSDGLWDIPIHKRKF